MAGLTLDTGALIAIERGDRAITMLVKGALKRKEPVVVPAGVVAQAWRDPRRQVPLVQLLATEGVTIETLDAHRAKAVGQLCGIRRTTDVIDASVVLCAKTRKHTVLTSDPDDLRRLDPDIDLFEI